ncbi:hypothetical protein Q9966_012878 [Columba livia]|nr:hypothetical protein Q9966_012878 [Columba livia]
MQHKRRSRSTQPHSILRSYYVDFHIQINRLRSHFAIHWAQAIGNNNPFLDRDGSELGSIASGFCKPGLNLKPPSATPGDCHWSREVATREDRSLHRLLRQIWNCRINGDAMTAQGRD